LSTTTLAPDAVQQQIAPMIDKMIAQLPDPKNLTPEQRRGIIARYAAVLEPNFIYWMTAAMMAAKAEEVGPIIMENLHEEITESHPVMLRKFTVSAKAYPTESDAMAVDADLTKMRLFLGQLNGVKSLVTMAFFEGYIQKFMPYLAELAEGQGSSEKVYTDVHGVCDVEHSQELFRAVQLELAKNPPSKGDDIYEGVTLLRTLINTIIDGPQKKAA
jgi:hypothetical protein